MLTAVALGNTTSSGIARYTGRPADQLSHPLNVLADCGLVVREPDLLRAGRSTYRVIEPLVTFYHAIMRGRLAGPRSRSMSWCSQPPTALAGDVCCRWAKRSGAA